MPYTLPYSSPVVTHDVNSQMTRRGLLLGTAAALAIDPDRPASAHTSVDLTVTEALRVRRSVRSFLDRPIDPSLLAELLWAAFGINRQDQALHTAPSWRGAADITVHLANSDGILTYIPDGNTTQLGLRHDIRGILSSQPFVATAPVCLVYVSDLRKLSTADLEDQKRTVAQIDAAVIAQNVYLFAASKGLGTCLVGGLDRPAIVAAMNLPAHEFPTFVQPVGWPA
ncbi:MAG: nitroreductase family protein [Litorimonas sp.]